MLNQVIAFALKNRLLILAGVLALIVFGSYQATELSIDVFPDLHRPTSPLSTSDAADEGLGVVLGASPSPT